MNSVPVTTNPTPSAGSHSAPSVVNPSPSSVSATPGAEQSTPAVTSDATDARTRAAAGRGVHISEGAVHYAKQRLAQRGTPDASVRVGVKGGGCSGFSYVIEFSDDPPRERDIVQDFEGVRFLVDKKSLLYLGGSTLDYVKTLMFQGFKFLNPQEASKCGCGHSFTLK